jgi:hypothetical protein
MSAIMSYIAPLEGTNATFAIMANVEVSAKEKKAAINQARRHYCHRVIPRGGKAVMAMRTSVEGHFLSQHVKQDNGHFANILVSCDEDEGHFVSDKHGEYVCDHCGIVNDFEDNFVFEETNDVDDEPVDEDSYEAYEALEDDSVPTDAYMKAKDGAARIEARILAHQQAYKASLTERPADEKYAKHIARETKDRHDAVMRANKAADQRLMYEAKWRAARSAYRQARLLTAIKDGMQDAVALRAYIDECNSVFYSDLEQLKAAGRITSATVGRKTTLTYVAKDAPARHVPARKTETSFKEAFVNWHTEKPTSFPWKE